MKKLFVSVLAIAGLVACATDDVVRTQENRGAIAFDTFVENATRADNVSTTTASINEFSVWAYMTDATGIVFNDELVSRNGDAWTYTNLQYWLAGNNYSFAAFAGDRADVQGLPEGVAMAENGFGTITFTNVEGANDILYAQNYVENAAADQAPVSFQFDHLLSKVRFTFANGFANENNTIVVKDIKMTSAESATLDLSTASFAPVENAAYVWENHAGTVTLDFGHMAAAANVARGAKDISDEDRLVIPAPATQEYVVTFTVEVYNGAVKGLTRDMEVKVSGVELVAGHSYNFVATINHENLNLNAIEFLVEVDEWEEFEFNGGAVEDEVKFVSSIDELQAALDANIENICLGADIKGNAIVRQVENVNYAINGNGFQYDGTIYVYGNARSQGAETLTIQDVNFYSENVVDFISSNSTDSEKRYAHNVTVRNCTFAGNSGSAALRIRQGYNIVVVDCQAEGIHSLAQNTSCSYQKYENCTVTAGRGLNILTSGNVDVVNCNFNATEADGYAVRVDAGNANVLNIIGSTLTAYEPIVLRSAKSVYTLNIEDTTLNANGEYQIVVLGGVPAMNGIDGYTVSVPVTEDNIADALNTFSNVVVESEIDNGSNAFTINNNDVVMDMGGNEVKAGGNGTNNYAFHLYGSDVVVNDANIKGAGFAVMDESSVVVNDGTIAATPGKSGRNMFYVINNSTVTVNEGTYTFDRTSCYFVYVDAGSTCYINGGHFEKPLANNASKDSFVNSGSTGTVVITGGTFNVDPTKWVAEGYKATKNGKIWTVSAE